MADSSRPHDVVLFGATGFTGGLTAEYLARNAPEGCRWALAGRNQSKLEGLRSRLTDLNPACADLPLLTCDVGDASSLREVAESAPRRDHHGRPLHQLRRAARGRLRGGRHRLHGPDR